MAPERVSIIVPTFDRAPLIARSLDSVFGQTYPSLEVIVVDDGSTDETEKHVKERFGDRVVWHRHDSRKGAAAARNTGIRLAKGRYIAFQDTDDEWAPRKLELQMNAFSGAPSKVGVVYSRLHKVIHGRNYLFPPKSFKKTSGDIAREMLRLSLVGTPTAVVRRECFDRVGLFDESFPRLQDWELFIRISKEFQFICVEESLLTVREQADSLSSDSSALIKAVELLLAKHADDFSSGSAREIARRYRRLGWILAREGEYRTARRYWTMALKTDPAALEAGLAYAASFTGKSLHDFLRKAKGRMMSKRTETP